MDNLNYGVIGNCRSAALVSQTGSIDWLCLPAFDSPSVFAALLDEAKGGRFALVPVDPHETTQQYISRTNILKTTFSGKGWEFEVLDFMPRYVRASGVRHAPPDIIRMVRVTAGRPAVRVCYEPRLGYARGATASLIEDAYIKSATKSGSYESAYLYSDLPLQNIMTGSTVVLEGNHYFLLSYNQKLRPVTWDAVELAYDRTKVYWRLWVESTHLPSQYRDEVTRSALALKLLTYQRTGAILAALTTSLPESLGGVRNWDYRYCWIRDASMVIQTLHRLGHPNAAKDFLQFVLNAVPFKHQKVQIMYGIRGQTTLTERHLPWLAGYAGSQPVRVGNAAYKQKQNDIFGVLIDVLHETLCLYPSGLDNEEDLWTITRGLMREVRRTWHKPDQSIWEFRSREAHYTFSRVLCWVAADRAARIAERLGKPRHAAKWSVLADQIRADVLAKGWNAQCGAFTQSYGDTNMDAANLLMAHYHFLDPSDPKYRQTVLRTYEELNRDGLMMRYSNDDDFGAPTTSFTICTFWMVKSLSLIGEEKKAKAMYEQALSYSNHVGLFSEGIDVKTKRLLGNFPQAYSHLALIDAALALAHDTEAGPPDMSGHVSPVEFDGALADEGVVGGSPEGE
ncbi:MAG: glycoside hydrolase family 15 protein [Lentisphaerae bacterium]|nr:glycoside hydrolase family 15 protein [Lentisphaerota bacterium]